MHVCKFCGSLRKSENSLRNHERLCPDNKDRVLPKIDYSKRQHSNGQLKGTGKIWTDEQKEKARQRSLKYWTPEQRKRVSDLKKATMPGIMAAHPGSYSYNNFCGRSKKVWYKDQLMHSSWELEVAIWLDEQNIAWTRTTPGFEYEWDDKIKTYYPDFYLPDFDLYIEVKGYETDRDLAKWQVISNLIILKQKEITDIRDRQISFGTIRGSGRHS